MVLGMTNDAPRPFEVLSAFSRLSTLGHETVYVAGLGLKHICWGLEQMLRGSQEDASGDLRFGVGDEKRRGKGLKLTCQGMLWGMLLGPFR